MNNHKKTLEAESNGRGKVALFMFLAFLMVMILIFGFMIFSYLLSLATGAMLAILCHPLLRKLKTYKISSRVASLLLAAGLILVVIIPVSIFLSLAIEQGIAIAHIFSQNESFSANGIFAWINDWGVTEKFFNTASAKKLINEWVQKTGTMAVSTIVAIASQVPDTLLQILLIVISFFYFLVDGSNFIVWVSKRVPLDIDVRKKIVETFSGTTISVIWATLAAAAVQSMIMLIAFFSLSVPAVFLATAATFIFAWIPIVGSTPVWLAGAIYLYANGFFIKAILMLIFGLITSVSDNIVRPLILHGRDHMHPLVSLVAIFGGISIFGVIGVFIGPVVAAVLISLLQILPVIQQRAALRLPEEP